MGKYFCPDCNQAVDDVVCPVCGSPTESLSFDEGSPDGRSDRYDDSLLQRAGGGDADDADPDADKDEDDEAGDEA